MNASLKNLIIERITECPDSDARGSPYLKRFYITSNECPISSNEATHSNPVHVDSVLSDLQEQLGFRIKLEALPDGFFVVARKIPNGDDQYMKLKVDNLAARSVC